MKKSIKKLLIGTSAIGVIALPIATVVSCGSDDPLHKEIVRVKAELDELLSKHDWRDTNKLSMAPIYEKQKELDKLEIGDFMVAKVSATEAANWNETLDDENVINIYLPYATQSINATFRHALLSKGENHMYIWDRYTQTSTVDEDKFDDFLKTKRLDKNKNPISSPKSFVKKLDKGSWDGHKWTVDYSDAIDEIEQTIRDNPNKRVNLYLEDMAYFMDMYKNYKHQNHNSYQKMFNRYSNVIIELVSHGSNIGLDKNLITNAENYIASHTEDEYFDMEINYEYDANNDFKIRNQSMHPVATYVQGKPWGGARLPMLAAAANPRIVRYGSGDASVTIGLGKTNETGMQSEIFNARDKANSRFLFTAWKDINNFQYDDVAKAVSDCHTDGKQSLFIIGSHGHEENEKDYIASVWEKYHNDYKIFYKGHPGYIGTSNWVEDIFDLKGHTLTSDPSKTIAAPASDEKIFVINPAIDSESLTNNLSTWKNSSGIEVTLNFDKYIDVSSSSAQRGFNNNINSPDDFLEVGGSLSGSGTGIMNASVIGETKWINDVNKYIFDVPSLNPLLTAYSSAEEFLVAYNADPTQFQ